MVLAKDRETQTQKAEKRGKRDASCGTAEAILASCSRCCARALISRSVATYKLGYLSMPTKRWWYRKEG